MNKSFELLSLFPILLATIVFISHFNLIAGNATVAEIRNVPQIGVLGLDSNSSQILESNTSIGRSIKDNSNNMLEKSKKNKDSIRKEKDMYDIMRLHQMTNSNNDYEKEVKAEQEKKEKGKLQTVGGVVGEIIAVIVSEVVKLFGNMVSDVAREVTAHGFVSVFKQFTDLTGISLPEI